MNKTQPSPVSKVSPATVKQHRNLTGSARLIRDLAADIHKNVQEWNKLHLKGVTLLKDITLAKQNKSYSPNLQKLCDELEIVCRGLDYIVSNLGKIARQMNITGSLDNSTHTLFSTWHSTKFGQVAESIHKGYSQELKVKRKILEDVAHHCSESWKMLFLASWVHQPLLSSDLSMLLESMLIETGHRRALSSNICQFEFW